MPMRRLAFAVSLSLFAGLAEAQTGVRIVEVPKRLFLPAADGSNLLLEVECTTPPDSIWLATEELARETVPLQPVGNGRYQLNLGDSRVAALIPRGLRQGELFVFATAAGRTTKSTSVAWLRRISAPQLLGRLRTKNGTTALLQSPWPTWIDPDRTAAIEILGRAPDSGPMLLRAGSFEAELEQTTDPMGWQMPIARLPQQCLELGEFTIDTRGGVGSYGAWPLRFRLVPSSLQLEQEHTALRVRQRSQADVPGSREWLRVKLADITRGRVETTLESADGRTLVARRRMFERDSVAFALADGRYVLTLDRLENELIGDDHAGFTVCRATAFVPDRIGQLLRAVEASEDTFVRDEAEVDGAAALQFLLAKVSGPNGRAVTVDRFVDELASKSSQTGEPCRVKRVDGTVVTMQQWLREELRRLEAAAAKGGTPQDTERPSKPGVEPPTPGRK